MCAGIRLAEQAVGCRADSNDIGGRVDLDFGGGVVFVDAGDEPVGHQKAGGGPGGHAQLEAGAAAAGIHANGYFQRVVRQAVNPTRVGQCHLEDRRHS